jgi:hypothetical protein
MEIGHGNKPAGSVGTGVLILFLESPEAPGVTGEGNRAAKMMLSRSRDRDPGWCLRQRDGGNDNAMTHFDPLDPCESLLDCEPRHLPVKHPSTRTGR